MITKTPTTDAPDATPDEIKRTASQRSAAAKRAARTRARHGR